MKQCEQINDLYLELHDGGLDQEMGASLKSHLGACPTCRDDFMWYGLTVKALSNLEEMSPPPNYLQQLNAKLYPEKFSIFDYFKQIFTATPYLPLPIGISALAVVAVTAGMLIKYPERIFGPGAGNQVAMTSPAAAVNPQMANIVSTRAISNIRPFPVAYGPSAPTAGNESGFPSVAQMMDNNLLVKSARVDEAIESLKRVLPNLRGKLVENKLQPTGETVLAVSIPQQAYAGLTSELVNLGAVSVRPETFTGNNGAGGDVLLYIKFVR